MGQKSITYGNISKILKDILNILELAIMNKKNKSIFIINTFIDGKK